ncbi:MAG: group II intron reverse transcriptase/maturase [Candidatus Brocadiia bacterium]
MSTKTKAHSLTGRITSRLVMRSFRSVKRNRGAAGVDKVSIKMFEDNLRENLESLKADMKSGTFEAKPLRRTYIPKGPRTEKTRPLGIPVVRDRVAQEVLRRLLSPVFEPLFHDWSFGFRPERNCHMAIEQVLEFHRQGYRVVLDADIKGFFDYLPHHIIMQSVAEYVADGNILDLIQRFLTAGVMEDGVFKPTTVGTPQGGVISPLLANIALNHLDWQLDAAGYRFARYADDFVVVCKTKRQAQEAHDFVKRVLKDQLELQLSPEKTHITTYGSGYDFLGFTLASRSRRMRTKSQQKFKDKIRELTVRKHNLNQEVIEKLNRVIRGTANYFATSFSTCRWLFQKLDSWVRMRLRCMKLDRKNYGDNHKVRKRYFTGKFGLLTLGQFCTCTDAQGQAHQVTPR